MSTSLLIVDHSAEQRDFLSRLFEARGDSVRTAASASEARIAHSEHSPDVAVISLPLADAAQSLLPAALLDAEPLLNVIILVDKGNASQAAEYVWRGALCLERPVDPDALVAAVERVTETKRMRAEVSLRRHDERTLTPLPAGVDMLIDLAARNADAPVLIVGETGTGKKMVARLIHDLSTRSGGPFLTIRCTTTAKASIERRLFGGERGASGEFHHASVGLLEMADKGSILVDSVASLPYDTQTRLLEFVEEGVFRRAGGTVSLRSDARIMAASIRPLAPPVDAGLFRADLFYRLHVLTIALPPLRERIADFHSLVESMLPQGASVAPAAFLAMQRHTWPGNIRELQNALWRASLLCGRGTIDVQHLPLTAALSTAQLDEESEDSSTAKPLKLAELEKRAILTALKRTNGNKLRAAALLGIARSTLHEKLRRL